VDPEVEALYGLPLDEFTKARDALARSRSKEQGKEAGAEVKALRKPSVVPWALNQLARRHPDEIEALLEAGARLRRAQTATLEGGDPDELREASKAEAAEVRTLADQAGAILRDAGRGGSAGHLDRLAGTLRAAAVDEDAGDQLRRGVLTAELSPAGFGFGVGEGDDDALASLLLTSAQPSGRSERKQRQKREEEAAAAAERERRRELEAELRAAEETASRMEREADKAEERAREARKAAADAKARAEKLARQVDQRP
jgi:hypothetical protein